MEIVREMSYKKKKIVRNMGLPQAKEMISDDTKFDFDTESVWNSYLSNIEKVKRKAEGASSKEEK